MHAVILGNGIVALAVAFRLSQRIKVGDRIVVVGKPERTGSATLAAAAMLNSFAEVEAGSVESELDQYRFELSQQATRMWPAFEAELLGADRRSYNHERTLVHAGTYVINNSAADDLDDENYEAIVTALEECREPFQLVSPRDIPNYQPDQRYRATRALHIPGEGWVNPRALLELLDAILASHPQVDFVHQAVDRLVRTPGGVECAILENGQAIPGDKFVLATGASVSDILARSNLGISVQRVFYGVGVSIEISSADYPHVECIRTPNRGLACGIYSVPYLSGADQPNDRVLLGATNFISPTPYHFGRLTSVESLMKAGMEQINRNFYRADLVRVNVGWRPTSQDTYPILGKTSIANLLIASGTKRDGLHLSPLISRNIVAMLFDEKVEDRFSWFAPERKPHRVLSRQQAIDKAVKHQVSAAYQHGFVPAKSRMPEQVMAMYRNDLERLHDKVGAHEWGIPPEMLDMYRYGHAADWESK